MSCKLWGKITSVSVNINFCAKMLFLCKNVIFVQKKEWNFERNVDFFIKYALPLKVIIFFAKYAYFSKMWLFLWRFIYINKVTNSDKNNFSFLGYVNLHMCWFSLKYFICLKIVILIQNVILCNDTLGKSVIFQVKSALHLV